jgi:Ku C terminal domain like
MQKRIADLIFDSFGTQSYPKAMSCLQVLRVEAVKVWKAADMVTLFPICCKILFGSRVWAL